MRLQSLSALVLAAVTLQGVFLMASAQATAKAGALYIIESTNATFVNANTLVLTGASPTTTYRITYPYKDAGVLDTTSLVTDPIYAPKGAWLGGAIGTIFGNGPNATALLLVINGLPALDPKTSALTFNVSIISDPAYLKFSDGVARMTYNKQVTPNSFAKAVTVTAQVNPGATLTGAALFLDVDQTVIVPASAPVPAPAISAGGITNNNNNIGYGNNNNNNNNGGGGSITNNNDNTGGLNNNNSNGGNNNNNNGGITNNNNNGGNNNNNNNGGGFTNNNNNGAGFTTTNNNGFGAGITNNNNNDGSGNMNNNNNGGGGTPVPSTPGQTPAPGTYNVITTTSDCNGHTTVEYSYVPGLRGISRNNNNNCG